MTAKEGLKLLLFVLKMEERVHKPGNAGTFWKLE